MPGMETREKMSLVKCMDDPLSPNCTILNHIIPKPIHPDEGWAVKKTTSAQYLWHHNWSFWREVALTSTGWGTGL